MFVEPVDSSVHTFFLQGVLRRLALGNVDDAVHVEADLFRVRGPVLVAEAVRVLPILRGVERMVARADRGLMYLVVTLRFLDLLCRCASAPAHATSITASL